MMSHTFIRLQRLVCLLVLLCLPPLVMAQQATQSDAVLAQQGALALASAHGEKPRTGGTFLSAGNEEIPFYDMHQTSFGGCMPRPHQPTMVSCAPVPTIRWP